MGVAAALAGKPLPANELAYKVRANPDALARLLQTFTSNSIFTQCGDGNSS
ncbi:hypothetical protein [Mycobacterium uberis]|uniref:hypothetical protein n=1 Tax=Mycobacterium uberis TaxID=2162698 RepID=UPI003C709D54